MIFTNDLTWILFLPTVGAGSDGYSREGGALGGAGFCRCRFRALDGAIFSRGGQWL